MQTEFVIVFVEGCNLCLLYDNLEEQQGGGGGVFMCWNGLQSPPCLGLRFSFEFKV